MANPQLILTNPKLIPINPKTEKNTFQCDKCFKVFSTRSNMNRHKKKQICSNNDQQNSNKNNMVITKSLNDESLTPCYDMENHKEPQMNHKEPQRTTNEPQMNHKEPKIIEVKSKHDKFIY